MNLNSREGIINRLTRDQETREQFVSSQLDKFIALQIRALRDRENMSQMELAEALGSTQNSVSRFESPTKGRPTITTLKKIAKVFDVGLEVRFVPFGKLVNYVSGTPYVETGLSTSSYYVPAFAQDPYIFSQTAIPQAPRLEETGYFANLFGFINTINTSRMEQAEKHKESEAKQEQADEEKKPPQSAAGNNHNFDPQELRRSA